MDKIIFSKEGYQELRELIRSCNSNCNNIRIGYPRRGLDRPVLYIGELKNDDIVENFGDFNLIINKDLLKEYGGHISLSQNGDNIEELRWEGIGDESVLS